jgi:hypothetical protein
MCRVDGAPIGTLSSSMGTKRRKWSGHLGRVDAGMRHGDGAPVETMSSLMDTLFTVHN